MSLVTLKNQIGGLLKKSKSDEELERIDASLSNNNRPYGSTEDGNDRTQEIIVEEAMANAAKQNGSVNSEDDEKVGFFDKFDPRVMSDIIIGLSDGLTVPFALTAGLSSLGNSKLVITGGMAELVSGAISMGLGGLFSS